MADLEMDCAGMAEAADRADEHPAGRVIGTTGYITTGTGFRPEDDPGNPTPGMRRMTADEIEASEGKVAPGEPEDQRCRQVKENGFRCRHIPAAGETFCHQHRRYRGTHAGKAIEVPLMEDPPSIRLVLSQAVRAMGLGNIPPANGRGMIAGCRMALDLLEHDLAKARLVEKTQARLQRAETRAGKQGARVASQEAAAESEQEAAAKSERAAAAESEQEAAAESVQAAAAELEQTAAAPVAVPAAEGKAVLIAAPAAGETPSPCPEPMEREDAERVSAMVTDLERAQEVLGALDAMEGCGEPEDAVLAAGDDAIDRPHRAPLLYTEQDLEKQWDQAIARPFCKPWKRTWSWEKKPEWKLTWPRPES